MPRRHHRREEEPRPLGAVNPGARRETHPDGEWLVASIVGERATKDYTCPGCQQTIPVGMAHVVSWRADDPRGGDERRHWHSYCWQRRVVRR
jgi:hypothetical protein